MRRMSYKYFDFEVFIKGGFIIHYTLQLDSALEFCKLSFAKNDRCDCEFLYWIFSGEYFEESIQRLAEGKAHPITIIWNALRALQVFQLSLKYMQNDDAEDIKFSDNASGPWVSIRSMKRKYQSVADILSG